MRYTDEGETTELCKWTVDLSSLPAFQQGALSGDGFYTGTQYHVLSVTHTNLPRPPPLLR